jgi:hypothetical protein
MVTAAGEGHCEAARLEALILRSAAKPRVSKDEGGHAEFLAILRDAMLRMAPTKKLSSRSGCCWQGLDLHGVSELFETPEEASSLLWL